MPVFTGMHISYHVLEKCGLGRWLTAVKELQRYRANKSAPLLFGTPPGSKPIIIANAVMVGTILMIMTRLRSFHLSLRYPVTMMENAPTTPPGMFSTNCYWLAADSQKGVLCITYRLLRRIAKRRQQDA